MNRSEANKIAAWMNSHEPCRARVDVDTNVVIAELPWVKPDSKEEGFDTVLICNWQQARSELGY